MGDRAMAEIQTFEGSIFFYTHYAGYELPKIAKGALQASIIQGRNKEPYGAKIVIDYLIKNTHSRDSTCGAGIMLTPCCEDEYSPDEKPSVIIDLVNAEIKLNRGE